VQLGASPVTNEDHGWIEGPLVSDVEESKPFAFSSGENEILLIRTKQGLRAFRNACAHQGLPLDRGMVDQEAGTITCPWHGFQFDSESGECFSAPQCQLEPFPLRIENERVCVRPV